MDRLIFGGLKTRGGGFQSGILRYVTGVNTTNIFTWMWDQKQLRESYFSFVSNTCVIYTQIK